METLYGDSCFDVCLISDLHKAGERIMLHLTAYHLRKDADRENPKLDDIRYGMVPIILASDVIYTSPEGKIYTLKARGSKLGPKLLENLPPEEENPKKSSSKFQDFGSNSFNHKGDKNPWQRKDDTSDDLKERGFDDVMREDDDDKRDKPWDNG